MSYPRPLSPHLQIYKPQLTSVLSISHRITGVALAVGTVPLVFLFWAISEGLDSYVSMLNIYNSPFGIFCMIGWSFCFFFHLSNGIRHLFWDAGYGFEMKDVYFSGWLVVICSVSLTAISWLMAYFCRGGCAI